MQNRRFFSVAVVILTAGLGTLRPTLLVRHVQLLKILVQAVSEEDLTSALPCLHLHDHLASSHFDLLLFHALAPLLHLLHLLLVTRLLRLALLPLFVRDPRHDLHRFLRLFLLIFKLAFVMVFDLFLTRLSLLLDQTVLQPVTNIT